MKIQKIEIGDIVVSLAGHDIGKAHLVISLNESFADIVDGKNRKIENPKSKKLKHLKVIKSAEGNGLDADITDKKIRLLLKEISKT